MTDQILDEFISRRDTVLIARSCVRHTDEAVRQQCDCDRLVTFDWAESVLGQVAPGQNWIHLSSQTEILRLQSWCKEFPGRLICVTNGELVLTKLPRVERVEFWRRLLHGQPYLQSVIVIVVVNNGAVLPPNIVDWETENRVIELTTD